MRQCSIWLWMVVPLIEMSGTTALAVFVIGTRAQRSCVGAHFNVVPRFVGRRYGIKIFVLVTAEPKKCHPHLRPSGR
jgi:hypothetical protein